MTRAGNRRRFIRHPISVPVVCRRAASNSVGAHELRDLSHGGLCFVSESGYAPGDVIDVTFPTLRHPASLRGEVAWTVQIDDKGGARHMTGLRFLDDQEHFRGRLIEQLCHIENYRRIQSLRYGRDITYAAAAEEWIDREADRFPG